MKAELTQEFVETVEALQKECHKMVEKIIEKKRAVSHQDAVNVFFYQKLAKLQLDIERLTKLVMTT